MDVFAPLVSEAAFWVRIDALIRIAWNVVGIVSIIALIALAAWLVRSLPAAKSKGGR